MRYTVFARQPYLWVMRTQLRGSHSMQDEHHPANAKPFGSALSTALKWPSPSGRASARAWVRKENENNLLYSRTSNATFCLKPEPLKMVGDDGWEERQNLEFQGNKIGNVGLGPHFPMWRKGDTSEKLPPPPGVICTSSGYHHLCSPQLQVTGSSLRTTSQKVLVSDTAEARIIVAKR